MMVNADGLRPLDSLTVDVISDNVSDTYVSKPAFATSEFDNVIRGGTKIIAGESLLVANLGYGLRLTTRIGDVERTVLFDTGTEAAAFLRNGSTAAAFSASGPTFSRNARS